MTTDTDIILSGPFSATDGAGRTCQIKAIRIVDESYGVLDVYVDVGAPLEAGAHADRALIEAISAQLRSLGYKGPALTPGERALQERRLIVLDAPDAFLAFAKSKGWTDLAAEFDDAG